MATNTLNGCIERLRRGALLRDEGGLTDGDLLAAYVARRDEAAFATLVRRHGPMVLGVCRRILHNDADAEDAFQATFLVLVRKAATIRTRTRVSSWLHGVAHNTALKARAMNRRRQGKEREARALSKGQAAEELWQQAQTLLDEALRGLPDKYRVAIVLCDLEGKTIKEAARQLACPQGTVATRLARGRALLTRRLSRHGLTLSAGTVAAVLSEGAVSASVPASLTGATVKAAITVAARHATTGIVSARVVTLSERVLKAMLLTKIKVASAVLVVLGVLGVAAGLLALPLGATQPPAQSRQGKAAATQQKEPPGGRPKGAGKAPPTPGEIAVIVTAWLYEVDDAFYKKLSQQKRLSMEDLEKLERQFLGQLNAKPLEDDTLFKLLAKQKPLLTRKEIKFDLGKEGALLSWGKTIKCLPSPDQVRKRQKGPQTVQEGVSLFAQIRVSADRRFVRVKFTEKSAELEGIDKVKVTLDNTGEEAFAEIPFLKESGHSQVRDIPDGGSFLLPLHYRPREARGKDRWLVLCITPRIYIEEEERQLRGEAPR
jgi:RNA polymerase sigma factor (sigma-70 family)